jgi:hypothetical protein
MTNKLLFPIMDSILSRLPYLTIHPDLQTGTGQLYSMLTGYFVAADEKTQIQNQRRRSLY